MFFVIRTYICMSQKLKWKYDWYIKENCPILYIYHFCWEPFLKSFGCFITWKNMLFVKIIQNNLFFISFVHIFSFKIKDINILNLILKTVHCITNFIWDETILYLMCIFVYRLSIVPITYRKQWKRDCCFKQFLHTEVLKGRRLTARNASHEHFSILPNRLT